MPLFRFRLEAQDGSGHIREGTGNYEDEEKAREFLEGRENKFVAFHLSHSLLTELGDTYGFEVPSPPQDYSDEAALETYENEVAAVLDQLPYAAPIDATEEEKAEFRKLRVNHRAWLNLHRQGEPYKLVDLEEVSE